MEKYKYIIYKLVLISDIIYLINDWINELNKMEMNRMGAKIINLADFKKNSNSKKIAKENPENKYINKYEESLKRMSKEEILAIEELLEN